jgi:hypothetical protein
VEYQPLSLRTNRQELFAKKSIPHRSEKLSCCQGQLVCSTARKVFRREICLVSRREGDRNTIRFGPLVIPERVGFISNRQSQPAIDPSPN